jgi:hypothetical protein
MADKSERSKQQPLNQRNGSLDRVTVPCSGVYPAGLQTDTHKKRKNRKEKKEKKEKEMKRKRKLKQF